jgi:nucleotide-binding universal stress UspA family protein
MSLKNILIAMPIEEELLLPLHEWGKNFEWKDVQEIHLVHIIKKTITPLEFGLVEMPDERTFKSMIPTLNNFLKDQGKKIVSPSFQGDIHYHLKLDFKPLDVIIDLIKKLDSSMVVVSTKGKHGIEGFFHSSFTEHLIRFAPCDVLVVRHPRLK